MVHYKLNLNLVYALSTRSLCQTKITQDAITTRAYRRVEVKFQLSCQMWDIDQMKPLSATVVISLFTPSFRRSTASSGMMLEFCCQSFLFFFFQYMRNDFDVCESTKILSAKRPRCMRIDLYAKRPASDESCKF